MRAQGFGPGQNSEWRPACSIWQSLEASIAVHWVTSEMTHRTQYDDLSDAELVRVLQKEATLLLEHEKAQQARDNDNPE